MVPADELIEFVWGSAPPSSVRATLQNYISRLRSTLTDVGEPRIRTLPHGYLITVLDDELDVSRFEGLRAQAAIAVHAGDWNRAAQQLRAARSLWHGEPLADVPSEPLRARAVPRLTELRLQAVESRLRWTCGWGGTPR